MSVWSQSFRVTAMMVAFAANCIAQPIWREFRSPESGFSVSMPGAPTRTESPMPSRDGRVHVYETVNGDRIPSTFSVFVGVPEREGVYDTESIEAYLSGIIRGLVAGSDAAKLLSAEPTRFRDQPARQYRFSHSIRGHLYTARGVVLAIDGGHMRISMMYPSTAANSEATFEKFIASFKLIPVGYVAAEKPIVSERGISIVPPKGWSQQAPRGPFEVARMSNLTRAMQLLLSAAPGYTCEAFQAEAASSGRLKSAADVTLRGRRFRKLLTFEDVPKYGVRLTTVKYCIDTRSGVAALEGTEEEGMFSRWAGVFEGTAASIQTP